MGPQHWSLCPCRRPLQVRGPSALVTLPLPLGLPVWHNSGTHVGQGGTQGGSQGSQGECLMICFAFGRIIGVRLDLVSECSLDLECQMVHLDCRDICRLPLSANFCVSSSSRNIKWYQWFHKILTLMVAGC